MRFAAPLATLAPAGSLPVSVAALTRSSSTTRCTCSDVISSVWNSPASNPPSTNACSMASAHCGTFEACLSNPTFPAMSAGAAKRNTCQKGKFQGMTASTGPIGS